VIRRNFARGVSAAFEKCKGEKKKEGAKRGRKRARKGKREKREWVRREWKMKEKISILFLRCFFVILILTTTPNSFT